MRKREFLMGVGAGLVTSTGGIAQAQINVAAAINRAARMRALSQRTVKAYAQWQLNVLPDSAKSVLATARNLIADGQVELGRAQFRDAPAQLLAALNGHATQLLSTVSATPTKESLQSANAHADRMLQSADDLTRAIEAQAKQGSARLINLAGRQRMLSQRLAKNYMLLAATGAAPNARQQMVQDRADFNAALKALGDAPISTPGIRNDLAAIANQWVFFEVALDKAADPESLRNMATTSERVLEVANDLTTKYEAALREVLGST